MYRIHIVYGDKLEDLLILQYDDAKTAWKLYYRLKRKLPAGKAIYLFNRHRMIDNYSRRRLKTVCFDLGGKSINEC